MSIAKRATNNIFWLFISEICAKAAMFLGTLYLARVLGVEGFGLYSLALAVAMNMWALADCGVTGYGIREVARDTDKAEQLLNTLNSLRFVLSIGSMVILFAILFILNVPSQSRWTLLAGGSYVIAYSLSPDWVLKGVEKMEYIALGNITVGTIFLGSIYFLVRSPVDTALATFYRSLAFLLGSLVILVILERKIGIRFSFKLSPSKWRMHLKESWYFAVNAGLAILGKFIPVFFLGIWATSKEMGIFSAPHRLVFFIIGAATIIPGALYPILSNLYPTDENKFQKTHISFQKLVLYLGLPIGLLGMFLSKGIMEFLYGVNYHESAKLLEIMIWLIPLMFLRVNYARGLLSAGFQKLTMFANATGAITTILFCFLLVPVYKGYGAVVSLVGGEILGLIFMGVVFALKLYRCNPFDFYFVRVLGISILMSIVVSKTSFPILLKLITGIGMYAVLSLLFGIVKRNSILKLYHEIVPRRLQSLFND